MVEEKQKEKAPILVRSHEARSFLDFANELIKRDDGWLQLKGMLHETKGRKEKDRT